MFPVGILQAARDVLSKAISLLCTLLLVVAVTGLIVFGIGPRTGRYRILTVLSGSMSPVLLAGSLIVVVPKPLAAVRVGDILTFRNPNNYSALETHRVARVLRPGSHPVVQTKGDANQRPDPWRLRLLSEPAWQVRLAIPGVGYVFEWMRTSTTYLAAVLFAPVLLGIIWLYDIWKPKLHGHNRAYTLKQGIKT